MRIVCDPPLLPAWLVTKLKGPALTGAFIVKGTFQLQHGGAATPHAEPETPLGDVHHGEDPKRSLRYASDFVPFKPRTDVLLAGTCHAPGQKPVDVCTVNFQVGSWSKPLAVIGDRFWKHSLIESRFTQPEPFTKIPIVYERAYGGEGEPLNPVGVGSGKGASIPMPNIETPGHLMSDRQHPPGPAGYGPLAAAWPQRQSNLGTYDKKWLKDRWPWLPEDFDYANFNAAPKDQQLPGYLRGDEPVVFENLHPTHAKYRSQLPGIRPRCFLDERVGGQLRWREVPLKLDTLWVDMDAEKLVLVWRGHVEVQSVKLVELERLYLASESLKETPASAERHREVFLERLPKKFVFVPEKPAPPEPLTEDEIAMEKEADALPALIAAKEKDVARRIEAMNLALVAAGVEPVSLAPRGVPPQDPAVVAKEIQQKLADARAQFARAFPNEPFPFKMDKAPDLSVPEIPKDEDDEPEETPWTRERVAEKAREGFDFREQNLSGLDLSGLDLSKGRFVEARLTGAKLSGARLAKADLSHASLKEADLSGADLTEANLEDADLGQANLSSAVLARAKLRQADFDGANLAKADLSGAEGPRCSLSECDLGGARLRGARLPSANLTESKLDKADFEGAELPGARLAGASAAEARFRGADLTRLQASDGAKFAGADFTGVKAAESSWEGAILDFATFADAVLTRATLTSASLKGATFLRCDLRKVSFADANLEGAKLVRSNVQSGSFERANLAGADLSGSNCYNAEFWDAAMHGANLSDTNLKSTKLA